MNAVDSFLEDYNMTYSNELPTAIGKILINLQALEFSLRLFLYETLKPQDTTLDLDQLDVGDWVSENPITNYDTLGDLVHKVNLRLKELGILESIDYSLVDLRDALAHGRNISHQPIGPFKLLKFSKAKQGKVQVITSFNLTPQWLKKQVQRTNTEVQKLARISRSIGLSCFPD